MNWNRIRDILLIIIIGIFLIGLIAGEDNETAQKAPPEKEIIEEEPKIVVEPEVQEIIEPKEKIFGSKGGAIVYCQNLVKNKLISPATAKFPWNSVVDVFPAETNTTYHVLSYVDSQNRFGATLRTYFKCKLKSTGNDFEGWEVIDLELE